MESCDSAAGQLSGLMPFTLRTASQEKDTANGFCAAAKLCMAAVADYERSVNLSPVLCWLRAGMGQAISLFAACFLHDQESVLLDA
ncbi:hypothetical protein QIH93_08290 [Bradyrhizobium ottawaense]|uniref:hypothetical protein n=1 Tax=Bradyrhizobium ottawaense TaxID=931866 RepID=UPI002714AB25|nr:hypothetical protein [Bradyrhizobium ottawaense]WLB47958.1 hypothetical protein QIH93_08290 [Bradyrhizobium ottawaense]